MTSTSRAQTAVRSTQAVALAGLAAYAAQAWLAVCGESATAFFEMYVYASLIVVGGALCLARAASDASERLPWLVLGAGLLAWAGGEVYYSAVLDHMLEPPLPSMSDGLWLAFYPCCYVALVLLVRARVREFHRSLWLDGIVGALAAAALGSALVFGALTAGGVDATVVAVDLSYFLGDLLLLGFVIGVLAVTGWRPGRALAVLTAGLAMSALADGFFLYQAATGTIGGSTLMATFWPASAILVGCAAWVRSERHARIRLSGWRVLVMPLAFALLAVSLLAVHAVQPLNGAALGFAVATLVGVMVRLALTFRENLQLLEGTRRQALTDALTGLPNRRKLMDDLNAAAAAATETNPRGLILFDLDGFKQYNDRYGHPVGDALLARLGQRLGAAVRPTGRAYRLGGDEFAVIAGGGREELAALAANAREALSEQGKGFEVSSSCGVVELPTEAEDVTHALHVADERLYAEKGGRRRTTLSKETSDALLQVLKERQPSLREHLGEVAQLAVALGERLGLEKAQLDELGRAAELHDIGKIAVPEEILTKAGPLDDREWEFVRQHTLVGDRILSAAPTLSSVAKVVRASHENFDGSGYPDALVRDEIPLGARIVAVCDAYHAMTSDRPYRRAVDPSDALEELRRCAGQQFDPAVVDAFCELFVPEQPVTPPLPATLATELA
jgi:two-component system cell cycle response regulator